MVSWPVDGGGTRVGRPGVVIGIDGCMARAMMKVMLSVLNAADDGDNDGIG